MSGIPKHIQIKAFAHLVRFSEVRPMCHRGRFRHKIKNHSHSVDVSTVTECIRMNIEHIGHRSYPSPTPTIITPSTVNHALWFYINVTTSLYLINI